MHVTGRQANKSSTSKLTVWLLREIISWCA